MTCERPFMLVHDLGNTFGEANKFNRRTISGVHLAKWSETPVWKDAGQCIGNLSKSFTGNLSNPRISEEGRKFLADLLVQLTDAQLRESVHRRALRPGPGADARRDGNRRRHGHRLGQRLQEETRRDRRRALPVLDSGQLTSVPR